MRVLGGQGAARGDIATEHCGWQCVVCRFFRERKAIEAQLRALAWSSEFVGRVHWDLSVGEGFRDYVPNGTAGTRGVIIVQPEPYGRTAQVIGAIDLDLTLKDQQWVLRNAVERFERSFEKLPYEALVEKGKTLGTELIGVEPEGDKHERLAKRKAKRDAKFTDPSLSNNHRFRWRLRRGRFDADRPPVRIGR